MNIPLRPSIEVQRAHDMLSAIVLGEVTAPPADRDTAVAMKAALDTLCWVLQHEHNFAFHNTITLLDKYFKAAGIEESKAFPS